MSLLPFFRWCHDTALAVAIRESAWIFPWLMVAHLVSLAVLAGVLLTVDLRLLGAGPRTVTADALARSLRRWFQASLVLSLATGALLFVSEALRCYETPPFWAKLAGLALALSFTFSVRAHVIRASAGPTARAWIERLTGAGSIALWGGVALMGRAIGFW